jgi:hypothetical protein
VEGVRVADEEMTSRNDAFNDANGKADDVGAAARQDV